MAEYDSDSSGADEFETNVLLGYASRTPTSDAFSQLGGHPTWLDDTTTPNGALARCTVCGELMSLLLQLNGDLPTQFSSHERRLYVWTCRRKACRRKEGSIRAFRAIRVSDAPPSTRSRAEKDHPEVSTSKADKETSASLGEALFGVKRSLTTPLNPFKSKSSHSGTEDPFSRASLDAVQSVQGPTLSDALPETFASKARISAPTTSIPISSRAPSEPWPDQSAFPEPFLTYYLDADKEYLESESQTVPSNARLDCHSTNGDMGSVADDRAMFESSMDKTFQHFADRIAQNAEQVLRYAFGGEPLLYSKSDAVGRLLLAPNRTQHADAKIKVASVTDGVNSSMNIPRCVNCGSTRVFEFQLTPHAIMELEVVDLSIDGMDWGTIIVGVCGADCIEIGKTADAVGYVEEWVGVQWEELAGNEHI